MNNLKFVLLGALLVVFGLGITGCTGEGSSSKKVTATTIELVPESKMEGHKNPCGHGFQYCKKTKECIRPIALMKHNNPKTIKAAFDEKCNP